MPIEEHPKTGVEKDWFAHLNDFESKNFYSDAGNYPLLYYKTRINRLRYTVRKWLQPYIKSETGPLARCQATLRNKYLDFFFAYTANLGSHTFYVLMLPFPMWFGYGKLTRDLVYNLGYGIYVSGFIKDFCCLPRPMSPPLHRVTLSGYTAKEYGFPSSHSANAASVSLLGITLAFTAAESWITWATLLLCTVYFFTLVIGRMYCGMHGFADIILGSIIGSACFLVREHTFELWDSFVLNNSIWGLILSLAFNFSLIYTHVYPVDDCPCFDDSVAFIGVIMGLDIADWIFLRSSFKPDESFGYGSVLDSHHSYKHLGIPKTILRIIISVIPVVIWKALSKQILLKLLRPIFSAHNESPVAKVEHNHEIVDLVNTMDIESFEKKFGVKVDEEELEDLQFHNSHYLAQLNRLKDKHIEYTCIAFRPRTDVTLIVRLIVYAVIPIIVVVINPLILYPLGLEYFPSNPTTA